MELLESEYSKRTQLTDFSIIELYIRDQRQDKIQTHLTEYKIAAKKIVRNCGIKHHIKIMKKALKTLRKRSEREVLYQENINELDDLACYG